MNRESIKKDIAIIGISCKFSQSENLDQFWKNLKEGNELIEFYTDEELIELGIEPAVFNNPNFVKIKTFVENSDSFDYPFFSYTKDEANLMDPQIRVLHEQVWLAIEDAGYNPLSYKEKVGMYTSASDNFNWVAHSLMSGNKNIDPFYLSQINNKNFLSTLISYNLNFKGPSIVIDTACSSSLTAVHLASRALLLRECSLAIAGGVQLNTSKDKGYFYQEGMIASKDGHCRAFDKDSTGTTGANGANVVVLKRLEDAIKDRDNVYAVIRSSASNNDGRNKVGYTAPSVIGQSDCIKMAHKFANIPYNTISYVEAHGTGTKLGDPVEIEALNKAFDYDTSYKCAIGSLKSNAGHLGHAAGIAGLIKTTLALKNKIIPPSLHYKKSNPEINFNGGPFFVNTEAKQWVQRDSLPLRAGVSSFGIGGTNAHVILESFQKQYELNDSRPFQLISYSAKSLQSLNNYTIKFKNFVDNELFSLPDLAYTLNAGREVFNCKKFIVCQNKEALSANLNDISINSKQSVTQNEKKNLVFMFPGQGSQYFKMGKDLYDHESDFKMFMDQGFKILFDITGEDYLEIIGYNSNKNIDIDLLNNTKYTQPILFLMEFALASVLLKWEIKPNYMIGHSLGEYVAACVAEVFSLENALRLIVKRSQLMSDLEIGDMIAVAGSKDTIIELMPESLSFAAINSQDSCVISGNKNDVDSFIQILNLKEISYSRLKTSHAFHSEMMDVILESYEKELSKVELSNPKLPFISNLSGKEILDTEATSPKYWVRHLRETVNFKDGLDFLLQQNNSVFIEIGPGSTLLKLAKQNKKYTNKHSAIELVRHYKELIDDNEKFTTAIGEIWNQHIKINWEKYYSSEQRNRISAPTYCFDHYKLDFIVDPFQNLENKKNLNDLKPSNEWFYMPSWKNTFLIKKEENINKAKNYLIFSDGGKLITSVKEELIKRGNVVFEVRKGEKYKCVEKQLFIINPSSENDFQLLFRNLENDDNQFEQIIFNWCFEDEGYKSIVADFSIFNNLCKNTIDHFSEVKKKITLLCALNHEVLGNEKRNITMISSMKQLYVCSQEHPNIFSCSIDIDPEVNDSQTICRVVDDINYNYSDTTIAYRNTNRWVEFYEKLDLDTVNTSKYLNDNKTYLITGGLGKVGKILTAYLCDTYNSKVILTGRRFLPSEDLWDTLLKDKTTDRNLADIIKNIKELKKGNRQIFYYVADVSDYEVFNQTVKDIENNHGKITGVIHAAGNVDHSTFKPVENLNGEIAVKQFFAKVNGIINLEKVFENHTLDFVWITSSLASILGGLTLGAYSVANAFMDSFVNGKKKDLKNWFCINLDEIGQERISYEKLIEVFEKSFSIEFYPQLIVSVKDPNLFKLNQELLVKEIVKQDSDLKMDRDDLSIDYVAPGTETEIIICEMIESFFGHKNIGILDDFFDIGGDSLKAMTFIRRINKEFKVEISIQDFYSNPNIKDLSNEIDLAIKVINIKQNAKRENTLTI